MPRLRYDDDRRDDDRPAKPIVQTRDDGGAVVTMPEGTAVPDDLEPDARDIEDRRGRPRFRERARHGAVPADQRIRQLNGALHEARRGEGAARAELDRTKGELAKANGTAAMLDQAAFENWGREAEGRHAKAVTDLAAAREAGDTKAEAAAFSDLSVAANDVATYKRNKVGRDAQAEARKSAPVTTSTDEPGGPSRATQRFLEVNPEVQSDDEMWRAALALHESALRTEKLKVDSPEYFDYVTKGLRDEFPDADIQDHPDFAGSDERRGRDESRLDDDGGRNFRSGGRRDMRDDDDEPPPRRGEQFRRPSGAAPVNRRTGGSGVSTDGRGRIRVDLTSDQIEAAKIAGVTAAQYAASTLKPSVKRRVDEALRRG